MGGFAESFIGGFGAWMRGNRKKALRNRPPGGSNDAVVVTPYKSGGCGRRQALARLALGTLAAAAGWLAGPAHAWQAEESRVDYRIEARLDDPAEMRLTGRETVSWTNRSGEAVSDAWFHLYHNAYSNNRSTHLVEAKGKLRGVEMKEGWGWQRVTSVAVARRGTQSTSGRHEDVTATLRYRRPDDGNEDDRTVFSVDLPFAVGSGETLEIVVEWEAQIPRVRRRTGYKDDFLLMAHWFPKLGVYEVGRGWNCHQFHMNSEFFANYGTYEVTLDLPSEYAGKVFGSGKKTNDDERSDRYVVTFTAPSPADQARTDATGRSPLVHGFAWTADTRFEKTTQGFDPRDWRERYPDQVAHAEAILGEDFDLSMRNVDVTALIHPERSGQTQRHIDATMAALFFYGLWWGEYPYELVTVVDPPWGGRAAGGMEYPTLFTCGTRLFTEKEMYTPESVTVHEAGHQFWYGLVGNNEFEAAWLDEGFNSYTDSEVLKIVYGDRHGTTSYASVPVNGVPVSSVEPRGPWGKALSLRDVPLPLGIPFHPIRSSGFLDRWRDQPGLTFVEERTDPRWDDRAGYLRAPDSDPIDTSAWEYADRASYRANSYPRTAVALRTLRGLVGEEAFFQGMRHYSETWRYRHPYPDDFFRAFQEGAGVECQWYFDEVFRSTATGDWSVEVSQARRPKKRGMFQGEGGEFLELPPGDGDEGKEPWAVEVMLRREGGLRLDVPVRMTFVDGTTRDELWTRDEQAAETWRRIAFESDVKLASVELDPPYEPVPGDVRRRIWLDADMSNDRWYAETDPVAPLRWGERVLVQVQHYLHWIGGVGG